MNQPIMVAFPTEYEAADLKQRLVEQQKMTIAGVPGYRGRIGEVELLLVITGMGASMSGSRIKTVLNHCKPKRLIMAGFAGALSAELPRGQVCVADNYGSSEALAALRPLAHGRLARLATADQVVDTPAAKAALAQSSACQLVDMEMSAVAAVAREQGVDLLGIRVISDAVNETVPNHILAHGYDQRLGRNTPLRMAFYLMTHPRQIGALKQFLQPLSACRRQLTDFLVQAIQVL